MGGASRGRASARVRPTLLGVQLDRSGRKRCGSRGLRRFSPTRSGKFQAIVRLAVKRFSPLLVLAPLVALLGEVRRRILPMTSPLAVGALQTLIACHSGHTGKHGSLRLACSCCSHLPNSYSRRHRRAQISAQGWRTSLGRGASGFAAADRRASAADRSWVELPSCGPPIGAATDAALLTPSHRVTRGFQSPRPPTAGGGDYDERAGVAQVTTDTTNSGYELLFPPQLLRAGDYLFVVRRSTNQRRNHPRRAGCHSQQMDRDEQLLVRPI